MLADESHHRDVNHALAPLSADKLGLGFVGSITSSRKHQQKQPQRNTAHAEKKGKEATAGFSKEGSNERGGSSQSCSSSSSSSLPQDAGHKEAG